MIYALQEMFPGHSVKRAEDGTFEIEAPGEYTFPRVTLEQLGSLATAAEIWRDGNNSCDCNRAALCFDEEAPCGDTAYTLVQLVVDGENWGIE